MLFLELLMSCKGHNDKPSLLGESLTLFNCYQAVTQQFILKTVFFSLQCKSFCT